MMSCGRVLWLSVIILLLFGVNRFFRFKNSSRGTDDNLNGSLGFKFDSLSLSIAQKPSSFLRLSVSFEEDNFELICIQELMHLPWSKPDNNGRNKRTSDANYSSCNNISISFSCSPLDCKTGISHRNPEETLFDYTRHRIFQLSKDRLRKFVASRILYHSNSVATLDHV